MKINRAEFLKILQAVSPGIATKELIEQSTSFIFDSNAKKVFSYNDEVAVSHPIGVALDGAVQAKELLQLLGKLKDKEIELSVEGTQLVVEGAKNKAGILLNEKTNIAEIAQALGDVKKWSKLPKGFVEAVKFCLFSVGKNNTKPLLTCINCQDDSVLGCDDVRITQYHLPDGSKMPAMNVPAFAIKNVGDYNPTHYSSTQGWVHFKNEAEVIYSCRVMEDAYPRPKTLEILSKIDGEEIALPDGFVEALECANIFSKSDVVKVTTDNTIQITIDSNMLTVRSQGPKGWFEEQNRIRYKGKKIEFEINPEFLQSILKHTNKMLVGVGALRFNGGDFSHVMRTIQK